MRSPPHPGAKELIVGTAAICGIAGILGPGVSRRRLARMADAQHHRGPDDRGVFIDETSNVGLAHNRLSIIDLSPAGHQPMVDSSGDLVLVFNGEIYNYRELAADLAPYVFRTGTDTEVILAAYARWGESCVTRFNGMFAFALWDGRRRRLFCARDRLGVKPFHYARKNGEFVFASEIKAIIAAGVEAAPDFESWAVYLAHGIYDHDDRTFFDGIRCLSPGSTLTVSDGTISVDSYWDIAAADPFEGSEAEASEVLFQLLRDSARLRLRADVPVGINLSGGIDSAGILTAVEAARTGGSEIRAFTAAFDDQRYDETGFAQQAQAGKKVSRRVVRLAADEVWDATAFAVRHQEAPFGGIATLAYQKLHAAARDDGVTVLLEGQGADELLAGYAYFRSAFHLDLLATGRCASLRRELRAETVPTGLANMRQALDPAADPLYQDGTSFLRRDLLDPGVVELAGGPPRFLQPFPNRLANQLYRDLRHSKLPRVLRMNDRLSMAYSRELRQPYLDYRIVELAFRLPAELKIRDGRGKYLLRRALSGRADEASLWANKRAVVTPQREWLRGPLAAGVEDIIESRSFRERGLFRGAAVRSAFDRFRAGEGDNAFFVWQWVNTELWFRHFIDDAKTASVVAAEP